MKKLLAEIRSCTICNAHLPFGPNPIVSAHQASKIILIGQAPGTVVHQNGTPWKDASGRRLREWLGVKESEFYDPLNFGIVPMGFCYPGKGKSGDLPPRKECAPHWHDPLFEKMPKAALFLLIGSYAQNYYLGKQKKKNLTTTVLAFEEYLPRFFPIAHPSPRNQIWMRKNPWFETRIVPTLQELVLKLLKQD